MGASSAPLPGPTFTCPRCYCAFPGLAGLRYCPHCGLPDAREAAQDTAPLDFTVGRRTCRVLDRIAVGSICAIYRCVLPGGGSKEGIFKIARDPCANNLVAAEAQILRTLHGTADAGRFAPFLPRVEESFEVGDRSGPRRRANVLSMHESIRSPEELYTLDEVRQQYPGGLDGRDVAWIWRRLLSVLGFVHGHDIVHGAVLPMHILIEPREHKLLLIDWCCARQRPQPGQAPVAILSGAHFDWYKRQGALRNAPSPALDIGLGARCMVELLGGDPVQMVLPGTADPALHRYFSRCAAVEIDAPVDAWRLLDDFDKLIEAMWGPRKFRVLAMPPKRRPNS